MITQLKFKGIKMIKEILKLALFIVVWLVGLILVVLFLDPSVNTMIYLKWAFVISLTAYLMLPDFKKNKIS